MQLMFLYIYYFVLGYSFEHFINRINQVVDYLSLGSMDENIDVFSMYIITEILEI
jgi:hypothetical protein